MYVMVTHSAALIKTCSILLALSRIPVIVGVLHRHQTIFFIYFHACGNSVEKAQWHKRFILLSPLYRGSFDPFHDDFKDCTQVFLTSPSNPGLQWPGNNPWITVCHLSLKTKNAFDKIKTMVKLFQHKTNRHVAILQRLPSTTFRVRARQVNHS